MALVRILKALLSSGSRWLAVCPLFLVGSRHFPIACRVGADPLTVRVASLIGREASRLLGDTKISWVLLNWADLHQRLRQLSLMICTAVAQSSS